MADRTDLFRKRVLEAESKAFTAKTEETRRAWLIVARDWHLMAEREHLKYHPAPESKLGPEVGVPAVENVIRESIALSVPERKN